MKFIIELAGLALIIAMLVTLATFGCVAMHGADICFNH